MNTARFTREQHIRRGAEFARIFAGRCAIRSPCLAVFGAANALPLTRIGLSVSKRHGNAVRRNRIKRLLREAFRLTQQELPRGLDLVLVPQQRADHTLDAFCDSLRRAGRQLEKRLIREPSP